MKSILDTAKQECKKFDSALALMWSISVATEKDFEDMSARAKRIAMATTMSQKETVYYLSHRLMKCAKTGKHLEIGFDY